MKINKLIIITLECMMALSKDGEVVEILNEFNFKQLEAWFPLDLNRIVKSRDLSRFWLFV